MSHHTTILVPGFTHFDRLADLPMRIIKKIVLDGDERRACWVWTGSFTKPRVGVQKFYPVHPDYDGNHRALGYFGNERGVPKIRHPGKRYAVEAHRYVYALLAGVEYDEVPKLSRCFNERCVNPWHVHEVDDPPITKRAPRPVEDLVASNQLTSTRLLALLKEKRPFAFGGLEGIEEEVGLPSGSLTEETVREYIAWDEANPDPDDE